MLTDPRLRSQVDSLWDKFWSGGLTNPLDAIEQFSYLLFFKRICDVWDEEHQGMVDAYGTDFADEHRFQVPEGVSCNSCLYEMYVHPGRPEPGLVTCLCKSDKKLHQKAQKWLATWKDLDR